MKFTAIIATLVFLFAAAVQWNDPDSGPWILGYLVPAIAAAAAATGRIRLLPSLALCLVYAGAAFVIQPDLAEVLEVSFADFGMSSLEEEKTREALGLIIASAWFAILAVVSWAGPRAVGALALGVLGPLGGGLRAVSLASLGLLGCAVATAPTPPEDGVVWIPARPEMDLRPREVVAVGLENPRGVLARSDGTLLVALAGTGREAEPGSGSLAVLERSRTGRFRVAEKLLDDQPSANVIGMVRRDEVFGMTGLARGDGEVLTSLAFFGGPSKIFRVADAGVTMWSEVPANINAMTWAPAVPGWFGVSSSDNRVVRLTPGGGMTPVYLVPELTDGQEAVPGYLVADPATGALLVSLFSGSPLGETGGTGIEIAQGAGAIIRVDPRTGKSDWVVRGLTAPTDVLVGPDGELYVLEFCSDFVDPASTRDALFAAPSHGGFVRFSGRLLRIDRVTGSVRVLADGLDAPTNLTRDGDLLYVSQGMGTPGRLIPTADGPKPLDGFIEVIALN